MTILTDEMTESDINALRDLCDALLKQHQPSVTDQLIAFNAFRVAATPLAVRSLLDRLVAVERQRDAARQQCLDSTRSVIELKLAAEAERDEAIREKVLATQAAQSLMAERDAMAARRCECAVDETCAMQREIDTLRAERDAMAALLAEASPHLWESEITGAIILACRIDAAINKEQSNG